MIENFMVAANETVSSFIFYQNLPGIYRVHDKPDEKRLNSFFDFLTARGYVVKGKKQNITSKDLQYILKQLSNKPDAKILNDMAIRSQRSFVIFFHLVYHVLYIFLVDLDSKYILLLFR